MGYRKGKDEIISIFPSTACYESPVACNFSTLWPVQDMRNRRILSTISLCLECAEIVRKWIDKWEDATKT